MSYEIDGGGLLLALLSQRLYPKETKDCLRFDKHVNLHGSRVVASGLSGSIQQAPLRYTCLQVQKD
jgi:hypothetical protein